MDTATKNLEDDHVHILRLIEVMEHITHEDAPDISHLEMIIDTIRNFADGIHHAKEENVLFPMLSKRGFPANQGPVAVMLSEHVQGRKFVKGIEDNTRLYKEGNKPALMDVYSNMNAYAGLLRSHISKENNILFRMADNVLSETDNKILLDKFSDEDRKHSRQTRTDVYIKKIEELVSLYKI